MSLNLNGLGTLEPGWHPDCIMIGMALRHALHALDTHKERPCVDTCESGTAEALTVSPLGRRVTLDGDDMRTCEQAIAENRGARCGRPAAE